MKIFSNFYSFWMICFIYLRMIIEIWFEVYLMLGGKRRMVQYGWGHRNLARFIFLMNEWTHIKKWFKNYQLHLCIWRTMISINDSSDSCQPEWKINWNKRYNNNLIEKHQILSQICSEHEIKTKLSCEILLNSLIS
jgi:hypothetical protein